ncbi:RNA-guided endonuclease TnpB family protein [Planococcus lenghuensis]|uniref:RNA-guided endonuclease TnpB family protein n=1 Tax=Planococcus lenghuensis TaxID=2213202 RepID=UPI0009863041|nr:RNA-guided endonuclease TnpB family protein [Planococcus lenghuensis]
MIKKQKEFLKEMKQAFPWPKAVDKFALEKAVFDLDGAYQNFFEKRAKYPVFKSKHNKQSYKTNQTNNNIALSADFKQVKLPKLGWVRCACSEKVLRRAKKRNHRISSATISEKASVITCSLLLEKEKATPVHRRSDKIGIDMGLTYLFIDSNGHKETNPRYYVKTQKRLAKLQRKLAEQQRGSHRYLKTQRKIAKLHALIANQWKDLHHKLSQRITDDNQVVYVEKLHVRGMVKNKRLAKHIQDAAWYQSRRFLTYKAERKGGQVLLVDRWTATSSVCSNCEKKKTLLNLNERKWICAACHTEHDRDINAATNILREGLKQIG